jgi:hypothetical protein
MYRFLFVVLIVAISQSLTLAGDGNVNVLSYYAVTNSLDGQPMIDMTNILRFYPVFSMRDNVDHVNVTIYYGGNIFSRDADKLENGKYWQTLLPIFKLGEAIQRMEVDVHFSLDSRYKTWYIYLTKKRDSVLTNEALSQESRPELKAKLKATTEILRKLGISYLHLRTLRKSFQIDKDYYKQKRDSIFNVLVSASRKDSMSTPDDSSPNRDELSNISQEKKIDTALIDQKIAEYIKIGESYLRNDQTYNKTSASENDSIAFARDSIKMQIAKEIEIGLVDTNNTGLSVRKSDIIIDTDFVGARILYRNYKTTLRYMPALDPAEKMGIFRVRYVPFPMTALSNEDAMRLHGPFGGTFTVFEVGLAFGDAIVPGDEFVLPEFSLKRVGVAFGITEKLFNSDAEVIALAFTYDFNSYGSIGVGGNFAQNVVRPYASFGINKKAFEAVLGGLAKLFK